MVSQLVLGLADMETIALVLDTCLFCETDITGAKTESATTGADTCTFDASGPGALGSGASGVTAEWPVCHPRCRVVRPSPCLGLDTAASGPRERRM